MADPLSVFTASLAIVTAAIQSAKDLVTAIQSTRTAPGEVAHICQDIQAFQSALSSFQAILKDKDIIRTVSQDAEMLNMTGNLAIPIQHCERLISDLLKKTRDRLQPNPDGQSFRVVVKNLKWALFTKREVKELRAFLEDAKSTLNYARGAITMCVARPFTFFVEITDKVKARCSAVSGTKQTPIRLALQFGSWIAFASASAKLYRGRDC